MKATNPAAERRSLCPGNKKLSIRNRIGCCGYRHVQTAVIAVFFCFLGMQFNSILFEHRNLYIDADASRNATYRIHNESDKERQCILDVCSPNSAYGLQCNYIGSKNYTICSIHISNIFPTNQAENSQSAITP